MFIPELYLAGKEVLAKITCLLWLRDVTSQKNPRQRARKTRSEQKHPFLYTAAGRIEAKSWTRTVIALTLSSILGFLCVQISG